MLLLYYYLIIITYPERNTEMQNVFLLYIAYRASDVTKKKGDNVLNNGMLIIMMEKAEKVR